MSENDLTPADIAFLELMVGATNVDSFLDEILEGFSEERAREVLASPTRLNEFKALVVHVAPGLGFKLAAAQPTPMGRLNAELFFIALQHRVAAAATDRPQITQEDGHTLIVPDAREHSDRTLMAHVELPDGQLWWSPLALDEQPVIQYIAPAPSWVAEFGSRSLDELARYALGRWLYRWHPGTGQPDNLFDETLLRLELGALAWQNSEYLGSDEAARQWLRGGAQPLLGLADRIQGWFGWQRELADNALLTMCDAYLALYPTDPRAADIAQLADMLRGVGVLLDLQAYRLRRHRGAPELALVAGDETAELIASGVIEIDPTRVPARSVSRLRPAATWELINSDQLELCLRVAAGDSPVDELTALVSVGASEHAIVLERTGAVYAGSIEVDYAFDEAEIEIVAPGAEGRGRPPHERQTLAHGIEDVVETRRAIYADWGELGVECTGLTDRPFLVELAAWDAELWTG